MASKSSAVLCILLLLLLLFSQTQGNNSNDGNVMNLAKASKAVSDKGFHAMSMMLTDLFFHTLNVSKPLTMFCPPDAAFFSSRYPQPPLTLLQYHVVPLKLENHEDLSFLDHQGSKIGTLLPGHPLVVTTLPTDNYESLNEVRVTESNLYNDGGLVTESNLYNDGGLIIHGIDDFFDPAFRTLKYPRYDHAKEAHVLVQAQGGVFSWVKELTDKWFLVLVFMVVGLGVLVFTLCRSYVEHGHEDDYVLIQHVMV